ncbi:hypothetical protein EJB05_03421, partial [Eragrostis curvula]
MRSDYPYLASKNDPIINAVIAACKARKVYDVMSIQKDWNNEIIDQFFATLYVEENDRVSKFYWMTEGRWFEVSYAQFARILGFGRYDANRPHLHSQAILSTSRMGFMYPRSMQGSKGHSTAAPLHPLVVGTPDPAAKAKPTAPRRGSWGPEQNTSIKPTTLNFDADWTPVKERPALSTPVRERAGAATPVRDRAGAATPVRERSFAASPSLSTASVRKSSSVLPRLTKSKSFVADRDNHPRIPRSPFPTVREELDELHNFASYEESGEGGRAILAFFR